MRTSRKLSYRSLTNHIELMINSNVYCPGDQLPTRRELAEKFGLTSYAVQEGFKYLEEKGLVVLKRGSGVYVAPHRYVEAATGWNVMVFLHITASLDISYLSLALQGIQEEALQNGCSLLLHQRDYYERVKPKCTIMEAIEAKTNGVIFLGEYDFLSFHPPRHIPSCGIEIDDCCGGVLSPVSIDPFVAAKLATDFFLRRRIKRVAVHYLDGGKVFETRAECFRHCWSKHGGLCEFQPHPQRRDVEERYRLPDDPETGHYFTGGTWCDMLLKDWRNYYGTRATDHLAMVSVDGKSLLVKGYEPVSTIAVDWHAAGVTAMRELFRRMKSPEAQAHRIYLIPKIYEL